MSTIFRENPPPQAIDIIALARRKAFSLEIVLPGTTRACTIRASIGRGGVGGAHGGFT